MNTIAFRAIRADEIDARIQSINAYMTTVLLYKDARVDQNILDETVGPFGWQRRHLRDNANCIVSLWDESKSQWVSKEDTGTESVTEKEKGLASDSFKRSCFNWGIGRELYTTPKIQIKTDFLETESKDGRLITWDKFYVDEIKVDIDDKGTKTISKLAVGLEHKGNREVVWTWDRETGEAVLTPPSWVDKPKSGYKKTAKSFTKTTTSKPTEKGWSSNVQEPERAAAPEPAPRGKTWGVKKA